MSRRLKKMLSGVSAESGEVYVEYVVLAGIAVLVILGAVEYFFEGISDLFQRMGDAVRDIGG